MAELGPAAVPFSLSPADELRPVLQRQIDKSYRQGPSYNYRSIVKLYSRHPIGLLHNKDYERYTNNIRCSWSISPCAASVKFLYRILATALESNKQLFVQHEHYIAITMSRYETEKWKHILIYNEC